MFYRKRDDITACLLCWLIFNSLPRPEQSTQFAQRSRFGRPNLSVSLPNTVTFPSRILQSAVDLDCEEELSDLPEVEDYPMLA